MLLVDTVAAGAMHDVVTMTEDVVVGGCGGSKVVSFRNVHWTVHG